VWVFNKAFLGYVLVLRRASDLVKCVGVCGKALPWPVLFSWAVWVSRSSCVSLSPDVPSWVFLLLGHVSLRCRYAGWIGPLSLL
jgi:hypothetical protein